MDLIRDFCQSIIHTICSKIFRVFIMFILTIITATIEIIYGIRLKSNSLIADGLYSFAEGLCLIGVILVLRCIRKERYHQTRNTFGNERLELLFGLLQEVFLLSISLGIIVDTINYLINPSHVHEPEIMIILGGIGIIVGLIGMAMFWGYHHDHDIEEEINENRKIDFLLWTKKQTKLKHKSPPVTRQNTLAETPLINQTSDQSKEKISNEIKLSNIEPRRPSILDAFTYENVEIEQSRIYATLHALCLHSFVILLESVIVISSGLMIKFIPHIDLITGKEINIWLKYVDPSLTLIMVIIIGIRAVPVIFSISEILIENVPAGIDTQKLMNEIVTAVPAIKSIHSLHIWRVTAKEIYATFHLVCDEDVLLSTCTNEYGRDIENILKSFCIRYFTLQFEYIKLDVLDQLPIYRCVHGLHRKRRGHKLEEPIAKLAKEAIVRIQ